MQGMGLSGCEDEEANEHFVEKLLQRYTSFAKSGIAVSDTIGSIYTVCPEGELSFRLLRLTSYTNVQEELF